MKHGTDIASAVTAPRTRPSILHWAEYGIEAAGLGVFMIAACLAVALLEHPASPVHRALDDAFARRALIGVAMGLTAIALIYSPWGKRSGAHLNPAVTMTFWWLGKIETRDALAYALAQALGGIAGVLVSGALLGHAVIADAAVNYVMTQPGDYGPGVAFVAEVLISFALMLVVLAVSNRPAWNRFTGLAAGALVAAFIAFEAPLSGMSMNPARSLASALPAHDWAYLWVYFLAPPLGMLAAAQVYRRANGARAILCCKLHHANAQRCIFRCAYPHA